MKRIIRDSVTGATNKPKNAVWVKDGQDMKWKIFKGTNNDTVDPDFLSLANKRNHANYIDVIVVPNGTHPNEVINSSSQNEYEYRKNIYLKRKHEFETLGEDDNNDVLSREEKMRIAKADMDKVAPKSVDSAAEYSDYKSDRRIGVTNQRYKGYMIRLDRAGYGYNVYDKNGELEDSGYPSKEAARNFIDELVSEADDEIESSVDIDEETEDPKWICLDIKHVRDSDGMLTDYALYTTEDEDKYICMFGDVDAYPPDEMYADAEFDSEEEALEWFEDYTGPGDGKEGVTKSGYQLNRKTADYLEEIQEVFPDAKRRGKLIVATNKGSANSSTNIKSSSEIIWDDLDWNQQIQLIKKYIRKYKGARIFEDFAEYIDEPVEDIIDAFSDAESRGDIRIPERMQLDSEYRNDDIYSSTTSSSRYWYFTRHGVQPGSVPKYVNILDIVDTPEGSYFLADGVISTDDLRNYEIKERKPKSAAVEASKSPNSAANKYPKYMKVSRGGQNFSVHYNLIDNSPSADAHQMWLEFQASVSAIKPYDDAEYAWAQIENGHINVIKGGKVIQQYYYFNADDMDVENTEWCDIIIDEAIDLIAKINKDIEPRMVYNSTSIETSADTKLESYRRRVYSKIYHFMTDRLGFDLTEVADYVTVDCTESEDGRIKIEVRAELDYDDMWELKTTIDPVVENIDKNAYFDFEYPGVLVAYVSSKPANSRYVHAADEPEHKTEPDDEYEPEEVDEDVTVEFDMDRVRIDVDKSGSWEYMDDSFLDAVMTDDTLYSEEYNVKVRDRNGLLEDLDDILKYDIPVEAGEYRISCHITLVYHVTGIEKYDEYPDDNYGDSSEYSTENAEVKFDFHDSYVEDFRIVD